MPPPKPVAPPAEPVAPPAEPVAPPAEPRNAKPAAQERNIKEQIKTRVTERTSIVHVRCIESSQIGPYGVSLDAHSPNSPLAMELRPDLSGVTVLWSLDNGGERSFFIPLSNISHIEFRR
jgi:hypothetical protein